MHTREKPARQGRFAGLQQFRCCWIGGHLTVPYEQNTQQSPAFGRSKAAQLRHS
jgi:hypothetical protein